MFLGTFNNFSSTTVFWNSKMMFAYSYLYMHHSAVMLPTGGGKMNILILILNLHIFIQNKNDKIVIYQITGLIYYIIFIFHLSKSNFCHAIYSYDEIAN